MTPECALGHAARGGGDVRPPPTEGALPAGPTRWGKKAAPFWIPEKIPQKMHKKCTSRRKLKAGLGGGGRGKEGAPPLFPATAVGTRGQRAGALAQRSA